MASPLFVYKLRSPHDLCLSILFSTGLVHIWAVWGPLVGRNSLAFLGVKVRLCHVPCAQVHYPVGI